MADGKFQTPYPNRQVSSKAEKPANRDRKRKSVSTCYVVIPGEQAMTGRTQFIVGSVMLALAIGILAGSLLSPQSALGQATHEGGQGRSFRYALVTGIQGTMTNSESLYVVDDANEILMVLEYSGTSHQYEFRTSRDLRRDARNLMTHRPKEGTAK